MDFFNAMLAHYDGSVKDMSSKESAGTPFFELMDDYNEFAVGVETGTSAPNITGIQKTGDNTFRVVATKVDAQRSSVSRRATSAWFAQRPRSRSAQARTCLRSMRTVLSR